MAAFIEQAVALHAINRGGMERADDEAKKLGNGGAWASVIVTGLSLAFRWVVLRRFRQRLIAPLVELSETLDAALVKGDPQRRCRIIAAPAELFRIMQRVNSRPAALLRLGTPSEPPLL